jgi:UDP-glucose 4-epimerase
VQEDNDRSFWSGQSVLVTGGAGFIGSHLVEFLAVRGARVTVADNLQDGSWANLPGVAGDVVRREVDVCLAVDIEAVVEESRPNHIFHLAANASVPRSVERPAWDFETNCMGTVRVLEAMRRLCPGARMVFASSGAVYGEPGRFPIAEPDPPAPISPYGGSKLAAESQCRLYRGLYGVDVRIARVFNTYGPRMPRFVVLDFLRKLRGDPGRLEILGSGRQVRDFTFVADTVAALVLLACEGRAPVCTNVASGTSCSVTQLAGALLRILGLEGTTRLDFTQSSWPGDAQRWEVDISRLASLGYRAATPLEKGLRSVVDWFATLPENGGSAEG